jgi:hypothetical protein
LAVAAPPEKQQSLAYEGKANATDDAREFAIASLKRKRKFAQDFAAYVVVNGLLWVIWLMTDRSTGGSIPWPAWVSIGWGFFLALDGWRAYATWPRSLSQPIGEQEIEREIERGRRF